MYLAITHNPQCTYVPTCIPTYLVLVHTYYHNYYYYYYLLLPRYHYHFNFQLVYFQLIFYFY